MNRAAIAMLLGAALALGVFAVASAQPIDPKRPRTLVVGAPRGASPTARVDPRRTGFSRALLPTGTLRLAWRQPLNLSVEHAPLVFENGDIAVVTARGDVVTLDADGAEKLRGPTLVGTSGAGAATLLSDGTVTFVSAQGDAIGVRGEALRFRTRIVSGGDRSPGGGVAPLALDDGGVVVGSGAELVMLDAEGAVRSRATLEEPIAAPLVAVRQKIAAITFSGKVFLWSPGREPLRVGSFGGPIDARADEGAALVDDHTLLAVLEGKGTLVEVDLVTGIAVARATSPSGLFLGPPSLRGETAHLLAIAPGRVFALAIDGRGQEVTRVGVVTSLAPVLPDGGLPPLVAPPHIGTLVDAAGTLAFASPDGKIGVVTTSGAVDTLGDQLCGRASLATPSALAPRQTGVFAGLAASSVADRAARGAKPEASFVVACENGVVAKILSTAQAPPGAGVQGD